MKITIQEDGACTETEIVIRCASADEGIYRMLAHLRAFDKKLTGLKDGRTFIIDAEDVFYFESVDKRTYLYTAKDVYETPLRLYEIEERLAGGMFLRVSKKAVLGVKHIASLRPDFGGRLEVTLENGERISVSRQFAPDLKAKLGL